MIIKSGSVHNVCKPKITGESTVSSPRINDDGNIRVAVRGLGFHISIACVARVHAACSIMQKRKAFS